MSSSKALQMIAALAAGNTSEALASFDGAITEKVTQALDERKVGLASELYNEKGNGAPATK